MFVLLCRLASKLLGERVEGSPFTCSSTQQTYITVGGNPFIHTDTRTGTGESKTSCNAESHDSISSVVATQFGSR
jgi:hypothetical protein